MEEDQIDELIILERYANDKELSQIEKYIPMIFIGLYIIILLVNLPVYNFN